MTKVLLCYILFQRWVIENFCAICLHSLLYRNLLICSFFLYIMQNLIYTIYVIDKSCNYSHGNVNSPPIVCSEARFIWFSCHIYLTLYPSVYQETCICLCKIKNNWVRVWYNFLFRKTALSRHLSVYNGKKCVLISFRTWFEDLLNFLIY